MPALNKQPEPSEIKDGTKLLVLDVFQIESWEPITDLVASDVPGKKRLMRVKAVGSVANKVYQSGRIIPREVQAIGLQRTVDSGRQLTAFIDHPNDMFGKLDEVCGILVGDPTLNDIGQTRVTIDITDTAKGRALLESHDAGFEVGISQRALGREEYRDVDLGGSLGIQPLSVVTDIVGIYGYDFVPLAGANAGNDTQVTRVSDSVLAAGKPRQTAPGSNGDPMTPEELEKQKQEQAAREKAIADAVSGLKTSNETLAKTMTDAVQLLVDKISGMTGAPAAALDAAKGLQESISAILADKAMDEQTKHAKLLELGKPIQDAITSVTGTQVTLKDKAKIDAVALAQQSSAALTDSLRNMTSTATAADREQKNLKILADLTVDLGGLEFSAEDAASFRTRLTDKTKACKTDDEVKSLVNDSLEMINTGRAKERLVQLGYKPTGTPGASVTSPNLDGKIDDKTGGPRIEMVGRDYLQGAAFLQDKMVASGRFQSDINLATNRTRTGNKEIDPRLARVMDRFDTLYAGDLRKEYDSMLKAGGGRLTDAAVHADFETPYTLVRTVLFEAYADDIILGLTSFGTMENDRDQVPITRWRRESDSSSTYRPSVKNRAELRVGELQPMPKGKLTTEFFPIDAVARKLQTTMSDEFITRAKRRPDITGIAMAANNLVLDIRRTLQQEIFWLMLKAALTNGSTIFSATLDGDGVVTQFQVTSASNQAGTTIVIDPEDAETIVPDTLTVELASIAVPEYGTTSVGGGPGGTFFYVVDHANGVISFVTAAGAPAAPANTVGILEVSGRKAGGDSGTRFDMTDPTSPAVEHDVYMNRLLFQVQNTSAAMSQNTGYDPNLVVADRVNSTLMQQAKAYQASDKRRMFNGDGPVIDGNFGRTADLAHYASRVFPENFVLIGLQEATLYRVYEPLRLQGPEQTRDTNGALTGGKEWYGYQEDSVAVPITEKLVAISLFNS